MPRSTILKNKLVLCTGQRDQFSSVILKRVWNSRSEKTHVLRLFSVLKKRENTRCIVFFLRYSN